ncbi:hypothetical protein WMF19_08575 [Sorangium sp. So ce124]
MTSQGCEARPGVVHAPWRHREHTNTEGARAARARPGSMPFLVAIQSPNRSIQRRIATAGGSWSSSSRAPVVSRTTWLR